MTLGRSLALASGVIIGVTAVAPQSAPLFRTQVETLFGQWTPASATIGLGSSSHRIEQMQPFAFAGLYNPAGVYMPAVNIEQLARWSDGLKSKESYATVVRYATSSLASRFDRKTQPSELSHRLEDERIWLLEYSAQKGAERDPQNAFFPVFHAIALWLQGRRYEAEMEWIRASKLPHYRDYATFESDSWRSIAEDTLGRLAAEESLHIEGFLNLPHLPTLSSMGEQIGRHGSDEDKLAAILIADKLSNNKRFLDALVAKNLVLKSFGVYREVNSEPRRGEQMRQVDEGVAALSHRMSEPRLKEAWNRLEKLVKSHRSTMGLDDRVQEWEQATTDMATSRQRGAGMLAALITLLLASLVSLAASSAFNPGAEARIALRGATPHLLACASWVAVAATISGNTEAMSALFSIGVLHVALACQYGSNFAARGSALFCGILISGAMLLAVSSGFGTDPVIWTTLSVIPLAFQTRPIRSLWASRIGLGVSFVAVAFAMLNPVALVPAFVYVLSRLALGRLGRRYPWLSSLVTFAAVLGIGFICVTLFSTEDHQLASALALMGVGALVIGLILRPTEQPGKIGWYSAILAALFLGNMGASLAADRRGELLREGLRNETDSIARLTG